MLQSPFDLEIHARIARDAAMRDAERDRRSATCAKERRVRSGPGWPAAVALVRRWVAPHGLGDAPRPAMVAPAVESPGVRSTIQREGELSRPLRAADPYAALAVMADGRAAAREQQPSLVEEC
jgi:hypothetical protein